MQVASLELCKELYEVSGWLGDDRWYMTNPVGYVIGTATPRIFENDKDYVLGYRTDTPAYDLGYLLRKLPQSDDILNGRIYTLGVVWSLTGWMAGLWDADGNPAPHLPISEADTPEDAACSLAIDLFQQGVLKKESK